MRARKDPRRQLQGRIAKARGAEFERQLAASFEYYAETGRALVEKTPEPMRPVQSLGNGKFIAFYERKAQPDFKGMLWGGQTVVLEAKWTGTDRMNQNRVLPVQAEFMNKYHAMGAACYVIAGFASGMIYRIPWKTWQNMQEYFGRKYIQDGEKKLDKFLVLQGSTGIALLLD